MKHCETQKNEFLGHLQMLFLHDSFGSSVLCIRIDRLNLPKMSSKATEGLVGTPGSGPIFSIRVWTETAG